MASGQLGPFLRHLRRLAGVRPGEAQTDRQLLERFAAHRDDASFAILVERHGRLVFGVCLRVLGNEHDAADAFQATFLVLARRAGSVPWKDSIGNWLYGVARRIAVKARAALVRRQKRERVMSTLPAQNGERDPLTHCAAADPDPLTEISRCEACRVLDEELGRLPRKYQAPLVLCYLDGKTNEEAARELGWPVGSMSRQLTRARELLRQRLLRRGVALSTGALGMLLAEQSRAGVLSATLVGSTIKSALLFVEGPAAVAGTLSTSVVTLAEGMLKTMMLVKLKITLTVFLAFALAGAGAGGFLQQVGADKNGAREEKGAVAKQKTTPNVPRGEAVESKAPTGARPTPTANVGLEDIESRNALVLHEKLNRPVTLDKSGIIRNTPIGDAIEFLSDRYDVTMLVDSAAFKADQIENIESSPVHLPRLSNVKLETVLQLLFDQIGGSYLIKCDHIEITTRQRTRPEDWISNRSLPPLVTVSFENRPLDSALRRLSDMTGISIVVDVRATDKLHHAGQPGITAMLNNVPLDTAVRLLADMNELGVVAIDSVLYVTTKPNAEKLEKEQEARRQKMHDKEKKAVPDPKETKKTNK